MLADLAARYCGSPVDFCVASAVILALCGLTLGITCQEGFTTQRSIETQKCMLPYLFPHSHYEPGFISGGVAGMARL